MKIKLNRKYLLRNDWVVRCAAVWSFPDCTGAQATLVRITAKGFAGCGRNCTIDGRNPTNQTGSNPFDVVAEIEE